MKEAEGDEGVALIGPVFDFRGPPYWVAFTKRVQMVSISVFSTTKASPGTYKWN